jgi:hypothetical protein
MKAITRIAILLIIAGFLTTGNSYAQNNSSLTKKQRKELRLKKKQMRMKASLESRKFYSYLLNNKTFILEATQLYGPRGRMFSVTPSTNFFAVKDNKVIFQFGLGSAGRNGVGGLTAEGFVNKYEFKKPRSEKKALIVSGNIRPKGSGDRGAFYMTVQNDGNAYVHVTLPYGGRISMSGRLVSLKNASVFKGQTDF